MAHAAGHDINYIALAGALHSIGRRGGPPVPPLNLVGDFGGGGAVPRVRHRVRAARGARARARARSSTRRWSTARRRSMPRCYGLRAMGIWTDERGDNMLDSGAHCYDVYETRTASTSRSARIEKQFYARAAASAPGSTRRGPARAAGQDAVARAARAARRASSGRRRATSGARSWRAPTSASRRCSSMAEAPRHPHNAARGTFVEVDGVVAAGARAALLAAASRPSSARPRAAASTPTRRSPTGASPPPRSRGSARAAPSPERPGPPRPRKDRHGRLQVPAQQYVIFFQRLVPLAYCFQHFRPLSGEQVAHDGALH